MRLYNGRDSFYQWDSNQKVVHNFKVGDEVHFFNMKQPNALTVRAYQLDNTVVADVPNILLQSSYPIHVYWMHLDSDGQYTKEEFTFSVKQRPKPSGYVYTETEVLSYEYLDARISNLEENQVGSGGIPIPETAEVGQTIVVKAVDENGKPTEWVAESKSLLPFINKVVTTEAVPIIRITQDVDGKTFDVTEYDVRIYLPNGDSAITAETFIGKPTWVSLLVSNFKTDGGNTAWCRTLGTPHWCHKKSKSYNAPEYDSGWQDGIVYVESPPHATEFGVANWSGTLPIGTIMEVYGR